MIIEYIDRILEEVETLKLALCFLKGYVKGIADEEEKKDK